MYESIDRYNSLMACSMVRLLIIKVKLMMKLTRSLPESPAGLPLFRVVLYSVW